MDDLDRLTAIDRIRIPNVRENAFGMFLMKVLA
jgi:hypothetical protein